MRRLLVVVCLAAPIAVFAESPASASKSTAKSALPQVAPSASPQSAKDLPVKKVILYKNGVGYFEHAGSVTGNQRVSIDFTSSQLNDVLQSLTVLDEGGGRIAGVNYNSTTPLAEQLKTLALGMTDDPTSTELFQALRGQRVEVSGAPGGGVITGRLLSIETRTEKKGSDDSTTVEKFYLSVVAASGAVRVIELTPTLSVRPLDASLQTQLDRYLELLSAARANGLRHLTLNATGEGPRQLRVSYISEVPVWKSTYRIVFPRAASGEASNAIVQGWAVVDNTVGSDWDNVQLSLVAGSPQSFIQPLSQPLYTRRAEIPIATGVETTPQTHEAAEGSGPGSISGTITDQSGAVIPNAQVTVTSNGGITVATARTSGDGTFSIASVPPGTYSVAVQSPGFQSYIQRGIHVGGGMTANVSPTLTVGTSAETIELTDGAPPPAPMAAPRNMLALKTDRFHGSPGGAIGGLGSGYGAGAGGGIGGGIYRPSDALNAGDVSTNAFDDFFEYALTQPVTIHKNESAMVPILQQELPAEHVTLWNSSDRSPLRAVWIENRSKLTLDSGSFSIFENGEFAGEGLLDPIHPGEKRLLSYAADQAVKVRRSGYDNNRTLHHVSMHQGILVETTSEVTDTTYTIRNGADEARTVILEHPRKANADLTSESKPAETTATTYRFRQAVKPHETAELHVRERANVSETVRIDPQQDYTGLLISVSKFSPELETNLRALIEAERAVSDLNTRINDLQQKETQLADDEKRARENVTALKGNDAGKRFVEELNRAEDELQANRQQRADLEKSRDIARAKLDTLISQASFDSDITVATPARP